MGEAPQERRHVWGQGQKVRKVFLLKVKKHCKSKNYKGLE
jgi:hypothetical protein